MIINFLDRCLLKNRFSGTMLYMVVRMRHTKGKRNRVRSHHALSVTHFGRCGRCQQSIRPHLMCGNCGYYAGRQVVDVLAKLDKKERKLKEKELHAHEAEASAAGEKLNAEELSHR